MRLGAAVVAVVLSVLYALTLCPTVGWYDSAEFSGVAATLRVVPHPPGYPLYSFLGHAFTWLPIEPGLAVNLMSAVFGVVGALLLYLFAVRIPVSPLAATIGALTFGVAQPWWANAVVAEVYTPGMAWGLAVLVICQRAMNERKAYLGWVAAALGGTALGVHMSTATMGLGYVTLLVAACFVGRKFDVRFAALLFGGAIVATVAGALILLLVPFGPFQEIAPLGPRSTTPEAMWRKFTDNVQGGIFRGYFREMRPVLRANHILAILWNGLSAPGLIAGAVGLGLAARRHTPKVVALVLIAVGNVAFFFRYDVPDLEGFVLPTFAVAALGLALFVDALWPRARWAFVALPAGLVAWGFAEVDRSDDRSAREYGEAACAALPPNPILAMTSRPDEWRRYTVLLYLHEIGEGCNDVEFWGSARRPAIRRALARGRDVFAFVPNPRFADTFEVVEEGAAFRVRER